MMPRGPEPSRPRPAWSNALRMRRIALNLKQEEVAARTDDAISQGTISDLERGKVDILNMTTSRATRLAGALDWTLQEMQDALNVQLVYPSAIDVAVDLASRGTQKFLRQLTQPDTVRSSVRVRIPVYALAAAGAGAWTDEDVIDYIEVEPEVANRRNRTTFQVDGDSMEPTLSDGDYIHVDIADQDIRHDKIYVVKIKGDGIVVKRAWVYDDLTVELRSDNLKHKPLNPDDAIVIGRVFGFNQGFRPL